MVIQVSILTSLFLTQKSHSPENRDEESSRVLKVGVDTEATVNVHLVESLIVICL